MHLLRYRNLLLAAAGALTLSGCQYDVLSPSGWVGDQQRDLLIISTLLMLIVIIPVLIMAVYFPLKYRADREDTSTPADIVGKGRILPRERRVGARGAWSGCWEESEPNSQGYTFGEPY